MKRGYALLMVLMILALIALGLGTVMFVVEANLTSTRRILGETRCFYATDSASRIASAVVQAFAATLPPQSDPASVQQAIDDAKAAVCSIAGGCGGTPSVPAGIMPNGVTMTQFDISLVPTSGFRMVTTGPFKNIVVRNSGMSIFVEGRDDGTGRTCHVRDSFTTGTASPFQFMMFASGDAYWYAHGSRTGVVPAYASGNLCIGAFSGATMNLVRAGAGGFLKTPGGGGSCPSPAGGSGSTQVMSAPYAGTPDGINTFENATVLKLPIDTTPPMQGDNSSDLLSYRWIVDPVISSQDNQAEQQLRMADVADVRIIDGVWYLKRQGYAWPGVPVYSDHPGRVAVDGASEAAELLSGAPSGPDVGSEDVLDFLTANGFLSGSPAWPPRLYSYYETQTSAGAQPGRLLDGGAGVVSYGALARVGGGAWTPGFYEGIEVVGGSSTCGTASASLQAWSTPGCDRARALVEGTRSGFVDYSASQNASSASAQTKVLPINFDVEAFVTALSTNAAGELGSYFQARPFNGVVYIAQTWRGSLNGLTAGGGAGFGSTRAPEQAEPVNLPAAILATAAGQVTTPDATVATFGALSASSQENAALFVPHNLCSDSLSVPGRTLSAGFAVPGCKGPSSTLAGFAYGAEGRLGTRPNAVRVYHGSDLRPFQPDPTGAGGGPVLTGKGLTIASNLPLYVMGDWNTRRRVSDGNFPRSMLAGDIVTVLSNNWDDTGQGFATSMGGYVAPFAAGGHSLGDNVPTATSTVTVGTLVRGGLVVHRTPTAQRPANQSVEDLVRYLEVYGAGGPLALRGSVYVAGTAVFRDDEQEVGGGLPLAPFDWKYDVTLAQPTLQPAGIPRFLMGVTGKWKDTR